MQEGARSERVGLLPPSGRTSRDLGQPQVAIGKLYQDVQAICSPRPRHPVEPLKSLMVRPTGLEAYRRSRTRQQPREQDCLGASAHRHLQRTLRRRGEAGVARGLRRDRIWLVQ